MVYELWSGVQSILPGGPLEEVGRERVGDIGIDRAPPARGHRHLSPYFACLFKNVQKGFPLAPPARKGRDEPASKRGGNTFERFIFVY